MNKILSFSLLLIIMIYIFIAFIFKYKIENDPEIRELEAKVEHLEYQFNQCKILLKGP